MSQPNGPARDLHGPVPDTSSRRDPLMISTPELAARYGVTTKTIRTWEKAGAIPARADFPGHPRWWLRDITRWEEPRRQFFQLASPRLQHKA